MPTLDVSGGVAVVFAYANMMAAKGVEVDIISLSAMPYNGWYGRVDGRLIYGDGPAVAHALSDIVYDAAVATFWPTIFALRSGVVRSRKVLYLVQGVEEDFYDEGLEQRALVRDTLTGPETKIAVSTYLQDELRKRYGLQSEKIVNGIDLEVFQPTTPFMSRSRKTRVIVEGAVVSPHKRVHEALSLLRAVPNVERWVLSASFYEPPYIDCELLLKMVPRSRISQVYSSADYLVKLSKSEGFGLSPLEMMACGGLPIVEDFGGQRDYLKDGENGFLLPERSRAAMKDVFERATDDRLVRSMRSNAVDTARAFAWGPQGEHLLDAIAGADVLNSGSAVHSVSMGGEVVKPKGFASIELKRQSPITAVRLRGWLAKRGGGDAEGFKIGAKGGSLLQVKAHVVRADVREARHVDGTYGFDVLFFLPSGSSDDIETRLLDKDTELVVDELRSYHVYPVSGYPDSIEAKFDAYAGAVLATSAGGEYDFPELYGTHLRFINSSIRHCRKLGGELRLLLQKHDAEEPPISVAAFYGQP